MYKKVKSEGIGNTDTMKQEIEDEKLTREKDEEINPYQRIVVNNTDKDNIKASQMSHCSILSNMVKYLQHDGDYKNLHDLSIIALDEENDRKMCEKLQEDKRHVLDIDFGNNSDNFRRDYLDMYEGVQLEVLHSTRFDENC